MNNANKRTVALLAEEIRSAADISKLAIEKRTRYIKFFIN
jgi:hypothetical protein